MPPRRPTLGTYALIDSNATGTGLSNYTISYAAAPTGLTVNPAALTITASDQSKTYGTVANLGTTAFSTTGLLNSDVVSGLTLASAGSPATANVGTYAMTGSDATGTGLSNYTITYAPAPTGLTVKSGLSHHHGRQSIEDLRDTSQPRHHWIHRDRLDEL